MRVQNTNSFSDSFYLNSCRFIILVTKSSDIHCRCEHLHAEVQMRNGHKQLLLINRRVKRHSNKSIKIQPLPLSQCASHILCLFFPPCPSPLSFPPYLVEWSQTNFSPSLINILQSSVGLSRQGAGWWGREEDWRVLRRTRALSPSAGWSLRQTSLYTSPLKWSLVQCGSWHIFF